MSEGSPSAGFAERGSRRHARRRLSLVLAAAMLSPVVLAAGVSGKYAVSEPLASQSVTPARRFAFLIGEWRAEQIFPVVAHPNKGSVVREDWTVQSDGSLLGKSYDEGDADPQHLIEIRLIMKNGHYYHTLRGASFTGNQALTMPVVQWGIASFVSVNATDHVPVRTSYDLAGDGSIVGSIYSTGDRDIIVYRMTRLPRQ